jgi:ABC-type transport system involved in multi-copper enzyme maturation permease subunit
MKYIAILKDSLRESIDTWVFPVMLGLSALVILLMGSVSFRPVSVEEDLHNMVGAINWWLDFPRRQGQPMPTFGYDNFQQLNPSVEPWNGDYHFQFTVELPQEALDRKGGRPRDLENPKQIERMLQEHFSYLGDLEVKVAPSEDPKDLRFDVTSKGTKIKTVRGWKHELSLFFGALPLSFWNQPLGSHIIFIEHGLVDWIGATVAILIGLIITGFFIPNMLRKGNIDLLLVKPIRRPMLLTFKFLGGLLFMFINTAFVVLGIWLMVGLRSGIWAPAFLLTIPILTLSFAIPYSVSALAGVLTRSPIVSILASCVVWALLLVVGVVYAGLDAARPSKQKVPESLKEAMAEPAEKQGPPKQIIPDWAFTAADTIHFVLPRSLEISSLTGSMIEKSALLEDNPDLKKDKKEQPFNWTESLSVTGAFIALMLGLACWRFSVTDY